MNKEQFDKDKVFKTTKRWSLLAVKHTSYCAAQAFAFCACQFDDLYKFTSRKLED